MTTKRKHDAEEWLGERFRRLVNEDLGGPTAVASAIGVREQSVINWYSRPKGPTAQKLKRLGKLLKAKLGWDWQRMMDELVSD